MTSWLARAFRGWRLDHNPLRRPSDRFETIAGALLVVAFAAAASFTVHAAAAGTYAHALSRRRMAAWEAEWAAVEPRWNPQHW
jgi:hypothetical protein